MLRICQPLPLDPNRLAQALGNLFSNAIKYTPAGGRIVIHASLVGQAVCVQVQDSGTGIALEDQERIFKPFYRGRTDNRFPEGMGLGLAIAHDLVTAHGGRLEVQSTPGFGSAFCVYLPLE